MCLGCVGRCPHLNSFHHHCELGKLITTPRTRCWSFEYGAVDRRMMCSLSDNSTSGQRRLLYGQLSLPVDNGVPRGSVDFSGSRLGSINDDGFIEEERQLLRGVRVRAATVDRLVALVVNCFGGLWLYTVAYQEHGREGASRRSVFLSKKSKPSCSPPLFSVGQHL